MQNKNLSDKILYMGTALILIGFFSPVLKTLVKLPYYWFKYIVGKFFPRWALVNSISIELSTFSLGLIFLIFGAIVFIIAIVKYKRE